MGRELVRAAMTVSVTMVWVNREPNRRAQSNRKIVKSYAKWVLIENNFRALSQNAAQFFDVTENVAMALEFYQAERALIPFRLFFSEHDKINGSGRHIASIRHVL